MCENRSNIITIILLITIILGLCTSRTKREHADTKYKYLKAYSTIDLEKEFRSFISQDPPKCSHHQANDQKNIDFN